MSSNPFDNIGARFVSWNAAWVQRDKKIVFDILDVRFGSLADLLGKFSLMSASGWKAAIRQQIFKARRLNVCFWPKAAPNFAQFLVI